MSCASRAAIGLLLLALAACSLPGRGYPVSPGLSGRIAGRDAAGATLEWLVINRDVATLAARRTLDLALDPDPGGPGGAADFYFEPIELEVAGREFGHYYRAWLSFRGADGETRILWRAEWSREAIRKPVSLDCDLGRSTEHGQPCQVEHASSHQWLVEQGEREYLRSCSSCHGVGATGDGPMSATLPTPPPELAGIAARHDGRFERSAIIAWVDGRARTTAHGSSVMPVWGRRLSREFERYPGAEEMAAARIDSIVTYLESVQRR